MTEPAARTNRSLMENIRYPGLGTLIFVACLSFIPLMWPLLLYVSLRYLTGHRSPGSPTWSIIPTNRNDARPSPVKAATTDASRSASSKRVPFAAAVVAFAAFAVVIAASGWVPAAEATPGIYAPPSLECELRVLKAAERQAQGLAWDPAPLAEYGCLAQILTPAQPTVAAHFDVQQTNVAAALASGLGIFLLLIALMRGHAAAAVVAFAAFAVVIAASGWVPEEVNLALYGTPGYGEPGIAAHFDARQTSAVAALASGLGIYFVLTVLMRGTAAPGTNSRLALDQTLVRTEATNVAPATEAKVCPRCAEDVKAAALVCRYCGHEFEISAT